MPGSGKRVACLLTKLVLVQLVCPQLFNSGDKWWVPAGVAAGYGFMPFRRLHQRLLHHKP